MGVPWQQYKPARASENTENISQPVTEMRLDKRSAECGRGNASFSVCGRESRKDDFPVDFASYPSISALSSLFPSGAAPPQRVLGSFSSNVIGLTTGVQ